MWIFLIQSLKDLVNNESKDNDHDEEKYGADDHGGRPGILHADYECQDDDADNVINDGGAHNRGSGL